MAKKAYDRRGKFGKKPSDLKVIGIRECLRCERSFKRFARNEKNFSCDTCNVYINNTNQGE